MVQLELWFIFLVPTRLRIGPLGAIGHPALFLGLLMFGLWAVGTLAPTLATGVRCTPIRSILAVWWLALLLSYAVMNRNAVPADQLANSDRFLISMLQFSGLALFAAEGIRTPAEMTRVIRTMVAGIASMCFIGLLQFKAGVDLTEYYQRIPGLTSTVDLTSILARSGYNRPAATATHPIEFGVVAGIGLAFVLHVAFFDRSWRASRRNVACALIAVGVPIAVSRSALLTATIVLVTFLVGATKTIRRKVVPALGVFLVVVFMTVPGLIGTMKGYVLAGNGDSSISTRTDDYAAVSGYLRQSPLIGRGPGSFLPSLRVLDNQYLMSLIEVGVIGFVIVLALFSLPAWLGRGGRMRSSTQANRSLGQAFAGVGFSVVAAAATYDAFSFPMFTGVVALVIGLSGAYWRMTRDGAELPDDPKAAFVGVDRSPMGLRA